MSAVMASTIVEMEKVLYETRKKARNSNKRYETRIKGTKFEEKARNSNKRYKTLKKVLNA